MEPEKFENGIKRTLQEREIKPSANSWDKLEQRLEQEKRGSKPYFWWVSAAAAVAVVFFMLGSYFNAPMPAETPQLVEESPEIPLLQEKTTEPEVLQVVASEAEETEEKPSEERPVKNAIFEAPVPEASFEAIAEVSEEASEAPEAVTEQYPDLVEEIKAELAANEIPGEVTDTEIEALLLLATAELETQQRYSVNADDLLQQVEYELEQSFRQKVFEVVKEGLLKAKTAVANRDF